MENKKITDHFSKFPAGLSGLGLGVGGLGNAFSAQLNSKYMAELLNLNEQQINNLSIAAYSIQGVLIFITLICFCLIALKMIWHFNVFKKEMTDPLISSYLPTEAMCLASIAYFIGVMSVMNYPEQLATQSMILNAGTIIANILIVISIAGHLALLIAFSLKILINHSFKNDVIYSSWLVPTCGIALSCGFEPKLGFLIPNEFFQVTWYFGFLNLLILLPYMIYKHIFFKPLDEDKLPSIAIFFAAPNLLLNGMLSIFVESDYYPPLYIAILAIILMVASFFGMFFYYSTFIKCTKVKFNAGYAAFTFPAAISALATIKMGGFIFNYSVSDNSPIVQAMQILVSLIGFWFLISATIIIAYILVRYVFLLKKIFHHKKHKLNTN